MVKANNNTTVCSNHACSLNGSFYIVAKYITASILTTVVVCKILQLWLAMLIIAINSEIKDKINDIRS